MAEKDEKLILTELVRRMNEVSIRLRDVEERVSKLEKGFREFSEGVEESVREIKLEVTELRGMAERNEAAYQKVRERLEELKGMSEKFATKLEVKEVEKLVDMFNPLTANFVTAEDVKRIVREMLEERTPRGPGSVRKS